MLPLVLIHFERWDFPVHKNHPLLGTPKLETSMADGHWANGTEMLPTQGPAMHMVHMVPGSQGVTSPPADRGSDGVATPRIRIQLGCFWDRARLANPLCFLVYNLI